MTHAYLSAARVAVACTKVKDFLEDIGRRKRDRYNAGDWHYSYERFAEEVGDTDSCAARLEHIRALAWAAREDTIAVSVEDFALFGHLYSEANSEGAADSS